MRRDDPRRRSTLPAALGAVATCLACAAAALSAERLAGPGLWWLGATLFLLGAHAWRTHVGRGAAVVRALGRERVELNLRASGLTPPPALPGSLPYARRGVLLAAAAAVFLYAGLSDDVGLLSRRALAALRKEVPVVRVEYPSYTETSALEVELPLGTIDASGITGSKEGTALEIDAASYLQFSIRNRKPGSAWRVTVRTTGEQAAAAKGPTSARDLPATGGVGLSALGLVELAGLDRTLDGPRDLLVEVSPTEGGKPHGLRVTVRPVPRPVVDLRSLGRAGSDGAARGGFGSLDDAGEAAGAGGAEGSAGEADEDTRLRFGVKVDSRVPLSLVELQVRTKSGYRFTKTVGEFANAKELTFESRTADVSLLGVPFKAPDSLFVKAVAKTVVAGLEGESREIEFRIRTRQEIREEIVKSLQAAKEELSSSNPTEASREAIRRELESVLSKAPELGRRHPVARQTNEALKSLEAMREKGDENALDVEKRIDAALESLRREKNAEEVASLMARLQNLRNTLSKPEGRDAQALSEEARGLAKEAEQVKKQLSTMADNPGSGFTLEEKQEAKDLLARDRTGERLEQTADALGEGRSSDAQAQAQQAVDEAQKGLGQVMQMMQAARQRAMRKARERLTQADSQLQEGRERLQRGEDPGKDIDEAGKALEGTPRLSREFNEALNEAKQQQRDAQRQNQARIRDGVERHVDGAQEAIVKALAALQEEEAEDDRQRREQDGRMSRSNTDALTAQGQLDVGWRKRILEEIARLKAAGESADSPVIRYLESRLR